MISQWALIIAGISYIIATVDFYNHSAFKWGTCFLLWGLANLILSSMGPIK